jgi:hypothetical protein
MKVVINKELKKGHIELTKSDIEFFAEGLTRMSKDSLRIEPIYHIEVV